MIPFTSVDEHLAWVGAVYDRDGALGNYSCYCVKDGVLYRVAWDMLNLSTQTVKIGRVDN